MGGRFGLGLANGGQGNDQNPTVQRPAGDNQSGSIDDNSTTEVTWLTSYSTAIAESKSSGKPVLVNFTGKAWCGWCIRLRREVFETEEFKQWAADNVVLLELDFPRTGTPPENRRLATPIQGPRISHDYVHQF